MDEQFAEALINKIVKLTETVNALNTRMSGIEQQIGAMADRTRQLTEARAATMLERDQGILSNMNSPRTHSSSVGNRNGISSK